MDAADSFYRALISQVDRQAQAASFNTRWPIESATVFGLFVRHEEVESLTEAWCWMFQSGRGASRQLLPGTSFVSRIWPSSAWWA
jgi:hypothetical protein